MMRGTVTDTMGDTVVDTVNDTIVDTVDDTVDELFFVVFYNFVGVHYTPLSFQKQNLPPG